MVEYTFKYQLHERGLHVDYLRIRRGPSQQFLDHWKSHANATGTTSYLQVAVSEWDAIAFSPSQHLFPPEGPSLFTSGALSSSISASTGYFNYLWNHPINQMWEDKLARRSESCVSILLPLRFHDWCRIQLGIGAEILLCEFLHRHLAREEYSGLSALVAHSLGWYDATLLIWSCPEDAARILSLLDRIRFLTLEICFFSQLEKLAHFPPQVLHDSMVAGTYPHLLIGFEAYLRDEVDLGGIEAYIRSIRVLVRTDPARERWIRNAFTRKYGEEPDCQRRPITGELGRYHLSLDLTRKRSDMGDRVDAREAFRQVRWLRNGHHASGEDSPTYTSAPRRP